MRIQLFGKRTPALPLTDFAVAHTNTQKKKKQKTQLLVSLNAITNLLPKTYIVAHIILVCLQTGQLIQITCSQKKKSS